MFYYMIDCPIGDYALITMAQFTKLLGKEAEGLSKEEIELIYDHQYGFARLAFNKWSRERGLAAKNTQKWSFCYNENNKVKTI